MRWLAAGMVALGLWGLPRAASACDPYVHVEQFWPAEDEPFAADGVFFATGAYLEQFEFIARVDGEEIELEILDRFLTVEGAHDRGHVGLRPVTVLEVGSTITIDRCWHRGCEEFGTWVVGEAATAPSPVDTVHTAVYSTPNCDQIGCTASLPYHGAVDAFLGSAEPPTQPRFSVLRLRRAVAPFDEIDSALVDGSTGAARLQIASPYQDESPVPDGLCVETRTFDEAGNEILPSHVNCTPCLVHEGLIMEGCPWNVPDDDPGASEQCTSVELDPLPPLDPQLPTPDPAPSTDDGSTDTTGDDDDSTTSGGIDDDSSGEEGTPTTGSVPPPDPPPTPSASDETGGEPAADDDGLNARGCGCRSRGPAIPGLVYFSLLLFLAPRRRV